MLYPGSSFRMSDDVLEAYIQQLIEAHAAHVTAFKVREVLFYLRQDLVLPI